MGKLYHLEVGCADASVIKTSSATFLIDCHNIEDYARLLPSNKGNYILSNPKSSC